MNDLASPPLTSAEVRTRPASSGALRSLNPRQRTALNRTLRRVFGLEALRDGQAAVIANVMAKRSTLALMPTGAGKSLCYQLPALLLPGHTVVVSPLIALIKDQVDKLNEVGVRAVALNSTLSSAEETEALTAIDDGTAQFIFTTPERIADPETIRTLRAQTIDLLVIDEAHCISHWGHDFRPAFLELGAARRALGSPPVLALTATANQRVTDDIAQQLDIKLDVISSGVYRDNLHFRVQHITREDERRMLALQIVESTDGAGIVYTATIRAATDLQDALLAAGQSAGLYHGRLAARQRHAAQEAFMEGKTRVMVATNAFGLGIDKPDIRFVLHYQLPPNLDAYYQEAGRAGRDGAAADCALLYFHQDRRLRQFLQLGRYPAPEDLTAVLNALGSSVQDDGVMTAAELVQRVSAAKAKVQVALHLLKRAGALHQNRRRELRLLRAVDSAELNRLADDYRARDEADKAALQGMVSYAQSGYCRWKMLLQHFREDDGFERCGRCDNCVSPPQAHPLKNTPSSP